MAQSLLGFLWWWCPLVEVDNVGMGPIGVVDCCHCWLLSSCGGCNSSGVVMTVALGENLRKEKYKKMKNDWWLKKKTYLGQTTLVIVVCASLWWIYIKDTSLIMRKEKMGKINIPEAQTTWLMSFGPALSSLSTKSKGMVMVPGASGWWQRGLGCTCLSCSVETCTLRRWDPVKTRSGLADSHGFISMSAF